MTTCLHCGEPFDQHPTACRPGQLDAYKLHATEQLRIWNEMLNDTYEYRTAREISILNLRKHWHAATGWMPPER